jgi:hypothetical protein
MCCALQHQCSLLQLSTTAATMDYDGFGFHGVAQVRRFASLQSAAHAVAEELLRDRWALLPLDCMQVSVPHS